MGWGTSGTGNGMGFNNSGFFKLDGCMARGAVCGHFLTTKNHTWGLLRSSHLGGGCFGASIMGNFWEVSARKKRASFGKVVYMISPS